MISNTAIQTIHTVVYFSLTPLRNQEAINAKARARSGRNLRFPWIHMSDPLAFHSANTLLSRNHAAVPESRASRMS